MANDIWMPDTDPDKDISDRQDEMYDDDPYSKGMIERDEKVEALRRKHVILDGEFIERVEAIISEYTGKMHEISKQESALRGDDPNCIDNIKHDLSLNLIYIGEDGLKSKLTVKVERKDS